MVPFGYNQRNFAPGELCDTLKDKLEENKKLDRGWTKLNLAKEDVSVVDI